MKRQPADFTLYRLRYVLGYSLLGLLYVGAVTIASIYTPGGLTQLEVNNLEPTAGISEGTLAIPNIIFHLLQHMSLSAFGTSILSIKLPAIILSIVATVSIFLLLRRWFKPNIAVLAMLIMITTGQFIYIGQNANSHILYIALTALILLFASLTLQNSTRNQLAWKIGLAISVGLSWYTPFFIYITLGLLLVALIHPHTRHHLLKKSERPNWFIAFAVFVATITPLVYLSTVNHSLPASLLGLDLLQDLDIIANLKTLLTMYIWVAPVAIGGQIAPVMDFSSLILILLGVLVLFRQSYTSRTYMIAAWTLLALPVLILVPTLASMMTVPLLILLAIGIETLLSEWYKLFPKNPYARGTGLILIVGLIGVMVSSGVDRFVHGYRYMPEAANVFSTDLNLVKGELDKRPVRTLLVVDPEELPLYQTLARHDGYKLTVATDPSEHDIGNALVTKNALDQVPAKEWELQSVITNDRSTDADRLYLYNTIQNQ